MQRLKDEQGATAVEYGIMVALIAIVIFAAVVTMGLSLTELFECAGTKIGALPNFVTCT